ncbi:MAG: DnaJ domain-containing protein [Candidatus Obscuribacterales bacterium]|nr:DnaJ domain-containing protein [Candidatus Obscuribacterales bacterium]
MQEFEEDYYDILGVERTAPPDEIRKAYISLAKRLHPDRFPNDPEQREIAQRQFAKVTRAHDIVSDGERRAEYDALLMLKRKKESQDKESLGLDGADPSASGDNHASTDIDKTMKMSALEMGETINSKWANKHLERADDLLKRRRFQEAETAMKEAVRLVPNEPRYHNKLAEIYFARGWMTLAMTEVQTSLRIDERDATARSLEARVKSATKSQETTRSNAADKKSIFHKIKEILTRKL